MIKLFSTNGETKIFIYDFIAFRQKFVVVSEFGIFQVYHYKSGYITGISSRDRRKCESLVNGSTSLMYADYDSLPPVNSDVDKAVYEQAYALLEAGGLDSICSAIENYKQHLKSKG